MIFSPVLLLSSAAILANNVIASPVLKSWNSSHAYSVAGTLDANQYDIAIAERAVVKAARNIGEIIGDYQSHGNNSITNITAPTAPVNVNKSADVEPVLKRIPFKRLCVHLSCQYNGPPRGVPDHPPYLQTLPSANSSATTSGEKIASKIDTRAIPTALYVSSPVILGQVSNTTQTRSGNVTVASKIDEVSRDDIKDQISYMVDGFLEAAWGIKGNLLDAGDLVTPVEVDELSNNIIHVVGTSRAAVLMIRRAEHVTQIDVYRQFRTELWSLADAIEQFWNPLNAYVIKIASVEGNARDAKLKQLVEGARHGSQIISQLIEYLIPEEQ